MSTISTLSSAISINMPQIGQTIKSLSDRIQALEEKLGGK